MSERYERDIVCGMYLLTTKGCSYTEINGKKYYFCCNNCKSEFDKDKLKYIEMNKKYVQSITNKLNKNMERDPVCGQMISVTDSKGVSIYKDNKYYFCCATCKKVFDNMPSVYADKGEGYYDPNNPNDIINGTFRIL